MKEIRTTFHKFHFNHDPSFTYFYIGIDFFLHLLPTLLSFLGYNFNATHDPTFYNLIIFHDFRKQLIKKAIDFVVTHQHQRTNIISGILLQIYNLIIIDFLALLLQIIIAIILIIILSHHRNSKFLQDLWSLKQILFL